MCSEFPLFDRHWGDNMFEKALMEAIRRWWHASSSPRIMSIDVIDHLLPDHTHIIGAIPVIGGSIGLLADAACGSKNWKMYGKEFSKKKSYSNCQDIFLLYFITLRSSWIERNSSCYCRISWGRILTIRYSWSSSCSQLGEVGHPVYMNLPV